MFPQSTRYGLARLLPICAVAVSILVSGCSTHSKRIARLRTAYFDGELQVADEESTELLSRAKKDKSLIELDQALVRLSQGRVEETENQLRKIRDQFSIGEPLDPLNDAVSWAVDERHRIYHPDDYERLFIQVFLAISNLLQDGDDAYAYANQIVAMQKDIENRLQQIQKLEVDASEQNSPQGDGSVTQQKPPEKQKVELKTFQKIALAPYIAGILHEATHRDHDSAERYFRRTIELNPEFTEARNALKRSVSGRHSQQGNGVLYVFVATGKGPVKMEASELPSSHALLIADRILSAIGDHTLPPTIAPIKISKVHVPQNEIQTVSVWINGDHAGTTETITDLGKIALDQHQAKLPSEIARAVVRRIIKKSAVYAGKDALQTAGGTLTDMLINLGGIAWEATEVADTRCWGLLPEKFRYYVSNYRQADLIWDFRPTDYQKPTEKASKYETVKTPTFSPTFPHKNCPEKSHPHPVWNYLLYTRPDEPDAF